LGADARTQNILGAATIFSRNAEKENVMAAEYHIRHLVMDVETAGTAQQIMAANLREIVQDLVSLQNTMEKLRATWQGASALEYFAQYDGLFHCLDDNACYLTEMSDKFSQEIPAWEEMARHLAGHA
jgi:uncharacterized protein YukE